LTITPHKITLSYHNYILEVSPNYPPLGFAWLCKWLAKGGRADLELSTLFAWAGERIPLIIVLNSANNEGPPPHKITLSYHNYILEVSPNYPQTFVPQSTPVRKPASTVGGFPAGGPSTCFVVSRGVGDLDC
jgi:hypothetical protein